MLNDQPESDPPRVLVVDDDQALVELLEYNLQAAGYQTLSASDGETALARLREQPVDLVILDLMLPGMDGLEVCQRIRQGGSAVPILMLTAKREVIDQVRGLTLGADDYLTKPFEMAVLLARVRALLRRSGGGAGPVARGCTGHCSGPTSGMVRGTGSAIDAAGVRAAGVPGPARGPGGGVRGAIGCGVGLRAAWQQRSRGRQIHCQAAAAQAGGDRRATVREGGRRVPGMRARGGVHVAGAGAPRQGMKWVRMKVDRGWPSSQPLDFLWPPRNCPQTAPVLTPF